MPDLSEGPLHGKVTVGATAVKLSSVPTNFPAGIIIGAKKDNGKDVAIGGDEDVTIYTGDHDGFPLRPDTVVVLPVSDASKVWLIAESGSQVIHWLGT